MSELIAAYRPQHQLETITPPSCNKRKHPASKDGNPPGSDTAPEDGSPLKSEPAIRKRPCNTRKHPASKDSNPPGSDTAPKDGNAPVATPHRKKLIPPVAMLHRKTVIPSVAMPHRKTVVTSKANIIVGTISPVAAVSPRTASAIMHNYSESSQARIDLTAALGESFKNSTFNDQQKTQLLDLCTRYQSVFSLNQEELAEMHDH